MKAGDLTAGSAKLFTAWRKLQLRWEQTQVHWHDSVSRDFEETYLTRLEPNLRSTLEIMRALAELSSAARQECDPERQYL
ncbi:MAG TPA: hypothetical protein VHY91_17675 [Pirellulales bacterium]|jgi:hypothetical protein|nr:hypothetical protein [Pirellulales bacterium]